MVQDERARHILYFGNGLPSKVLRIQHGVVKEGVPMVRIRFLPGESLMRFYDLREQDKEDQPNGAFIKEYPQVYLWPMCDDPDNKCSILLCDFFGQPTDIMNLKIRIVEELKAQQRINTSLKYENAALHMNIHELSQNVGKVIQNEADMLSEPMKKLRGQYASMGQEEEGV